ncbi:hypothetical protein BaRGS_00012842 [Batillaria attramentaria]|uniref:Uncharacterized protein n=1 Tax=Batillaria attramentaria TaxID=370345 RepID=A0ABD0L9M1_9CAEN
MEGVEDAEDILTVALDYLRQMLHHLQEGWKRRNGINHRNFIRKMSNFLPPVKARRLHLQSNLLGSNRLTSTRFASLDNSLDSSVSCFSMDDGIWVEEDVEHDLISIVDWDRTNFTDAEPFSVCDNTTAATAVERSSTPLHFLSGSLASTSQAPDPATLQKISMMEDELAALRKQIAALVLAQETAAKMQFVEAREVFEVALTAAETDEKESDKAKDGVIDMATILKDLGKVKLKPVERSPGGTPMQMKPKVCGTDPASIIAEALRKKFRNRVQHSPETDKENDHPDFDSGDDSPKFKFGQHLLKRTQRRLSLVQEKTKSPTSAKSSPLRDCNT